MKKTKKTLATAAALCAAANIASAAGVLPVNAEGIKGNQKSVYTAEPERMADVEEVQPETIFDVINKDKFDPIDSIPSVLYGPPDPYDPIDSMPSVLYGPPDPYDPSEPIPDLYGPPDWYSSGDVNNDGKVDIEDAANMIGYVNGNVAFSSSEEKAADFNEDGTVDIEDVVGVINQINGNDTKK